MNFQQTAQDAYNKGLIKNVRNNGVVDQHTRVKIRGMEIDILDGRIINGKYEIGSASRSLIE